MEKWNAEWSLSVCVIEICVLCAWECRPAPAAMHAWRWQDSSGHQFSPSNVGSRDWSQVIGLVCGEHLYLLHHCAARCPPPLLPPPLPPFLSHNCLHARGHTLTGKGHDAQKALTIILSSSMGCERRPATWQLELQLSTQEVHAELLPDWGKLALCAGGAGKDRESL